MTRFLTVGHGSLKRAALTDLLRGAGVHTLVDVRRFPGSKFNTDVGRDVLPGWLPDEGIDYVWLEALGGRRRLPAGQESPDTWWRIEMFRAYATHTRTPEFGAGLDALIALAQSTCEISARETPARAATTSTTPANTAPASTTPASKAPDSVAIMCSETVWWRCHRRIIADVAVLGHGIDVQHLMPGGHLTPHPVSPGARLLEGTSGKLIWPAET